MAFLLRLEFVTVLVASLLIISCRATTSKHVRNIRSNLRVRDGTNPWRMKLGMQHANESNTKSNYTGQLNSLENKNVSYKVDHVKSCSSLNEILDIDKRNYCRRYANVFSEMKKILALSQQIQV